MMVAATEYRPLVSIVVPFHDSERTLAACIESLRAQEHVGGDYEILLIDNNSSDASARIARRYPEAILLEESKPGAYAARNAGLRRARAPILAFTDADCTADPNWLRSILVGMSSPSVGVLLGHCRYPANASRWLKWLAAYENAKTEYVLDRGVAAHYFAYCNNMAVRASVFDQLGPFEEWARAADSELVHRLASQQPELKIAFRPTMRIEHREFLRARDRARRLTLYTDTNAQIPTFRELGWRQRLMVLRLACRC